jgi:hypothetical protein
VRLAGVYFAPVVSYLPVPESARCPAAWLFAPLYSTAGCGFLTQELSACEPRGSRGKKPKPFPRSTHFKVGQYDGLRWKYSSNIFQESGKGSRTRVCSIQSPAGSLNGLPITQVLLDKSDVVKIDCIAEDPHFDKETCDYIHGRW